MNKAIVIDQKVIDSGTKKLIDKEALIINPKEKIYDDTKTEFGKWYNVK